MSEISTLKPQEVFKYFDQILQIPRPSKKEGKIRKFLIDFAKEHNLQYSVDDTGNVLIYKPATKGKENAPTVILQSHMDMVPEKRTDLEHNFETDPIEAYIDGNWIRTKGTTLGADDGIGIAATLAVLASDSLEHPPIEALFTVDEETGMTGAFGIKPNFLKGEILINLDSEDEGELFIGSAGGMDTVAIFEYKPENTRQDFISYEVSIDKLHGGHSGDEIDKGYANAIKLLTRFLYNLHNQIYFQLNFFEGGKLRNAIPKDAKAYISFKPENQDTVKALHSKFAEIFRQEYGKTDPEQVFSIKKIEFQEKAIDNTIKEKLLLSLYACPHGVYAWSKDMEGLVETSTNLATVKMLENNKIEVATSQRSSVDTAKEDIATMVASVFKLAGADVSHSDGYPGWKPNPESKILKITVEAYKRLFGKEPVVRAIHAGLECGMFLEKYPHLDMISFGPTIKGAHTPEERLDIASTQKFWDLLVEVLKNIN